jgi:hypothetical protein
MNEPPMHEGGVPSETAPPGALHGRRLTVARVAWVAVAALVFGLDALSAPFYYVRNQNVCASAVCAGDANRLTPERLHALHELGFSAGFFAGFDTAVEVVVALAFATIAAVIFYHRSDDRMALFGSFTLLVFGGASFTSDLLTALVAGIPAFGFPTELLDYIGQVCFISFFYVFPDGWFVPRWTRWLAVGAALMWVPTIFFPDSPLALLDGPLILGLFGTTMVAQAYRFRTVSSPVQRQQTKWVVFGVIAAVVGFSALIAVSYLVPGVHKFGPLVQMAALAAVNGCFLLIPISIGVAMVRSRLYDIDVLINRTLVYGALTISLVSVYFGLVVALQYVLRALTGQNSQIIIVASTLVIAALFNPLRRRVQGLVDRRFYRRKYDAAKTLEEFGSSLREEVDLENLTSDLVAVVEQTIQPAHVSLWLRDREDGTGMQGRS